MVRYGTSYQNIDFSTVDILSSTVASLLHAVCHAASSSATELNKYYLPD
jgi:anti-anti-sigma regulatory factor